VEGQSQRRKCHHGIRDQRLRKRFEDTTLIALKMKEGATNQGKQVASRGWTGKETFSSRASRRNAALLTPSF